MKNLCEARNEFERRGHHPLLFFLKCLEDDDDDACLAELIREEGRLDGFADAVLDFRP